MIRKNLSIICLILLILSVFLLPLLAGASIIDSPEEDNLADDDDFSVISTFPVAWLRIPVHQMSLLLRLGISIFALFVVYLGGRSKHRRFNDRTIDAINLLTGELLILKTALIRAVFNFQVIPHPLPTNDHLVSLSHSILFLKRRSTKL
jgi:hypothetical protein